MKAVERQLDEIRKYQKAMNKTNSCYLKNDYSKCISRLINELREYCKYRNYDFKEIIRRLNAENKRNTKR